MASQANNNSTAAYERQLKKIYDCLNIGSNKKAVQEVDRLSKNIKDLTVFKALKALALIRMGKRKQAFEILDEINPKDDLDEVTLQTMTSCYKESVEVGRIISLYEEAAARKPSDPEIMAHLFMAYVRVFNFKRQKEIALQMYKNFTKKKRLYSFWAIMSLIMQSQKVDSCNSNSSDKRVCLSLAEKMCEKMIDEERTNEEIELYLMILRKQNKHEEEYRFLTGPICLRVTDHLSWFNRRRAYLCFDLKMYSRAFKHYFPTLIQEYPDQTEYYQGLFKSAFLLDTEAPSQQQPVAINEQQTGISTNQSVGTPVKSTSALADCFDIVERQCMQSLELGATDSVKEPQKAKGQAVVSKNLSRTSSLNPNRKRILRGPFIARLELYHTIMSNRDSLPQNVFNQCKNQFVNRYTSFSSLLLDFFQSFSKKVVCFYDMDYMLNKFKPSQEDLDELLVGAKNWLEEIKKGNTPDMNAYDLFHIELNYHMLCHALHTYSTSDNLDDRLMIAKRYIDLYDKNRELGKQATKTELLPVDHYCLLAINSIMINLVNDSKFESRIDSILLSLLVMAENAIINSPSNHQIKLILLKLYSFVGASRQSSNILLTLDIQHFQIDTLGHLLNPVIYYTGNYSLSRDSLQACLEFYSHGIRECFEGLTTSYRDGRFSKIEEISGMLRRLTDSLNAAQCVLLKGVVKNLNAATADELISASQSFDPSKGLYRMFRCPECCDTIKDSRDFKVLKSLHFETNALLEERKAETLEDEQIWLRLRYYLLRSAYMQLEHFAIKKSSCNQSGEKCKEVVEIELGLVEIETLMPKIFKRVTESDNSNRKSYLEPETSPIRNYKKLETLVDLVRPLVFCSDITTLTPQLVDSYAERLDSLVSELEKELTSITSLVLVKRALASLTIAVEFISLCVTSLVSINQIDSSALFGNVVGTGQTSHLTNKPTEGQQTIVKSKTIANQMINKTEAQLTKLSNLIRSVDIKGSLLDKITKLEDTLLSSDIINGPNECQPKASEVHLIALMNKNSHQAMLSKLKEKLLESYSESLKEIENTCRRKIKLLRVKI